MIHRQIIYRVWYQIVNFAEKTDGYDKDRGDAFLCFSRAF